jgi:hypothetical protein
MPTLGQPEENVQALKGIIGWFNQSSLELVQEYRAVSKSAGTISRNNFASSFFSDNHGNRYSFRGNH